VKLEVIQIKQDFDQNKRQVIKMLLDQILVVNLEVPKVVQQKFDWIIALHRYSHLYIR
jgi:hypothetical protein